MPMIAMTTSNSTNVNPNEERFIVVPPTRVALQMIELDKTQEKDKLDFAIVPLSLGCRSVRTWNAKPIDAMLRRISRRRSESRESFAHPVKMAALFWQRFSLKASKVFGRRRDDWEFHTERMPRLEVLQCAWNQRRLLPCHPLHRHITFPNSMDT